MITNNFNWSNGNNNNDNYIDCTTMSGTRETKEQDIANQKQKVKYCLNVGCGDYGISTKKSHKKSRNSGKSNVVVVEKNDQ